MFQESSAYPSNEDEYCPIENKIPYLLMNLIYKNKKSRKRRLKEPHLRDIVLKILEDEATM